uniref:methionine--tRNA ligase n=1 Tax=Lygus hesperus TaxID=30085 RepID=A0A0A9ZIK0_LYGHE
MRYNMDYFIRTTNETHKQTVHAFWRTLRDKGDIYLGKYEGWYSVSDESFLTSQNVTDGVDKNGKPCKISLESGHVVSWVEEENYMFRLSAFRDRLLDYYHSNPNCIVPEFRRREVIRTVEKGLFDLSVSRKREAVQN